MKNKKLLGMGFLFATALIWGFAFVFQREGMDHIGPLTFMAARCTLAVIFLANLLLAIKGPAKAFKFDKATLIGGSLCGVCMALANDLQQIGMVTTDAGKSGFITAMYILLVPIFSALVLRRKQKPIVFASVLLGAVGLFLLCVSGDFSIKPGDIWIIGCAFVFSWHILITDHFASSCDGIQLSFIQFVVATIVSWIAAVIFETPAVSDMIDARVSIIYCGILSAGVAFTLQIYGQKYTEPAPAALIMSLESVFGAIGGALVLHETMTPREYLGCVIMFGAILLVQLGPGLADRIAAKGKSLKENSHIEKSEEGRENG